MHSLACTVTDYLIKQGTVQEEDREIYDYGFDCLLSKAAQIAVLLVYGLLTGTVVHVAVYTLCFAFPREYIGGWHANSRIVCFCTFTLLAITMTAVAPVLPLWALWGCVLAAELLVLWRAPATHYNNPKTDEELLVLKRQSKRIFTLLAAGVVVLSLTPLSVYASSGGMGLLCASIMLLIPNNEVEQQ